MSYGYLSDGGRSYTITNPLTPSRWINYLISRQYQAAVDQVLQGNSLCINRHYHHSANCTGMRQFYIHDHKTGKAYVTLSGNVELEKLKLAVEAEDYKVKKIIG